MIKSMNGNLSLVMRATRKNGLQIVNLDGSEENCMYDVVIIGCQSFCLLNSIELDKWNWG